MLRYTTQTEGII